MTYIVTIRADGNTYAFDSIGMIMESLMITYAKSEERPVITGNNIYHKGHIIGTIKMVSDITIEKSPIHF